MISEKILEFCLICGALFSLTVGSAATIGGVTYDSTGHIVGSENSDAFSSPITYGGTTYIGGVEYNANGQVVSSPSLDSTSSPFLNNKFTLKLPSTNATQNKTST